MVRSSLTLSLITGRAVSIHNIRAGRSKPGLMRQHLASVRAATQISEAEVEGDHLGSRRLDFHPQEVRSGSYRFEVGSAGSLGLVLQTVLPPLALAGGVSQLQLQGGTHNAWAPPFDFLSQVYLPCLRQLGPHVELELIRYGFYPAGGGEVRASIQPVATLGKLDLTVRGALIGRTVRGLTANLPIAIAQREVRTVTRLLGWQADDGRSEQVVANGPGNAVMVELTFEHARELFTAFGQRGVRAEKLARELAKEVQHYLESEVPVGPHLADQLVLLLAIGAHQGGGGGRFVTGPLTQHTQTHMDLIQRFLNVEVAREDLPPSNDRSLVPRTCIRISAPQPTP